MFPLISSTRFPQPAAAFLRSLSARFSPAAASNRRTLSCSGQKQLGDKRLLRLGLTGSSDCLLMGLHGADLIGVCVLGPSPTSRTSLEKRSLTCSLQVAL